MADEVKSRSVTAWAAMDAKGELKEFHYEAEPLGVNDVGVKIECCAVCHSDVHLIDNDWEGSSEFPQVCGHEIIGLVEEVGEGVKHLRKGQRVAIGWNRNSCMACDACCSGDTNMCSKQEATCTEGQKGGFADFIRVNSLFAFKLPDGLDPHTTAPLMCGGVTVFSPIMEHTKPGDSVGILGCGGLGHLAIQFAAARGCVVTAFTSSSEKTDLLKQLGARNVILTTDHKAMNGAMNSFDAILVTVNSQLDWSPYVYMLGNFGKLIFAAPLTGRLELDIAPLIFKKAAIVGASTGGRKHIAAMLKFAAQHKIGALVEKMPFADINAAISRVRENKARFRVVLTH